LKQEFKIEGEYIELIQLLKATGLAQTGGHAKWMVDEGEIILNNEVETRKRAKLRSGDIVKFDSFTINLI